jgi:hypothetical protein
MVRWTSETFQPYSLDSTSMVEMSSSQEAHLTATRETPRRIETEVEGETFFGDDVVLLEHDDNLISGTSWSRDDLSQRASRTPRSLATLGMTPLFFASLSPHPSALMSANPIIL